MHKETLQELVRESRYPLDPTAVAEAIVVRAVLRNLVPGVRFRSDVRSALQSRAVLRARQRVGQRVGPIRLA